MSNSIYDIEEWQASKAYQVNDIVRYTDGNYYYCKIENSDSTFTVSKWGGILTHLGDEKPHFFWKPSYNSDVNNEPRIKSIRFGDGYEQRSKDGVNNNLITLDMVFNNRRQAETAAILHFLAQRGGVESFVFTPLPPRAKAKRFVCKSWKDSYNFFDNFNINVKFEEVPR